jgi:superfamily II DNA or RNA helicase
MHSLLKKSYPNKKISLLIGSTKEEERKAAKDALIIIATYGVAKEGFDVPLLDTLVYGTPISGKNKVGIIQSIGRLTREKEGKKGADVFDFVDDENLFKSMYYKRRSMYHSMNLEIKRLNLRKMGWGN